MLTWRVGCEFFAWYLFRSLYTVVTIKDYLILESASVDFVQRYYQSSY
jgi:hypothetical protein